HRRLCYLVRNGKGPRLADDEQEGGMKRISPGYAGTVLLLSITLAGYALSERRKPDFLAQPLDTIDRQIAGWNMTADEPLTAGILDQLKLTSYVARTYQK